jgi:hypothetical protein
LRQTGLDSLESGHLVNPGNIQAIATVEVKAFMISNYTVDGSVLKNITPSSNLTQASFMANIALGSGTSTTFYNVVNDKIGTGVSFDLVNGTTTTYSVLIYGDVTGDGDVALADLAAIKQHMLAMQTLSEMKLTAADVSRSSSVTISDLLAVKKYLVGLGTISQYRMRKYFITLDIKRDKTD